MTLPRSGWWLWEGRLHGGVKVGFLMGVRQVVRRYFHVGDLPFFFLATTWETSLFSGYETGDLPLCLAPVSTVALIIIVFISIYSYLFVMRTFGE